MKMTDEDGRVYYRVEPETDQLTLEQLVALLQEILDGEGETYRPAIMLRAAGACGIDGVAELDRYDDGRPLVILE